LRADPSGRASKAVCDRSLTGIAGSNPAGGMDACLVSVVRCQVEVSATGRSHVRRRPTEYHDREASIMRRPSPTRTVEP